MGLPDPLWTEVFTLLLLAKNQLSEKWNFVPIRLPRQATENKWGNSLMCQYLSIGPNWTCWVCGLGSSGLAVCFWLLLPLCGYCHCMHRVMTSQRPRALSGEKMHFKGLRTLYWKARENSGGRETPANCKTFGTEVGHPFLPRFLVHRKLTRLQACRDTAGSCCLWLVAKC